jgi:hypothetical protein
MKKLSFFVAFIAVSCFIITSCKKNEAVKPVDPLTSISMGKDTLTLYAGGHRQINFLTAPIDYSVSLLAWHSSDTTTVSVNSSGIITAKVPGIAKITVGNKTGTVWNDCLVFVLPKPIIPPVDSLKIGLLARYDFNNSGVDSSGNRYDGAVHNVTSATDRFGNVLGAYSFDGVSSYVSVPDHVDLRLNNTDFTINAWVKIGGYSNSYENNIVTKRITGANNGWAFGLNGPLVSPPGALAFGPGGGLANAYSTNVVGLNQWHMVTVTYDLSKQQISTYIDGVFNNATPGILSPNATITSLMYIGKDDPSVPSTGYYFQGSIDDVRVYNRGLSKGQIQQLYLANN